MAPPFQRPPPPSPCPADKFGARPARLGEERGQGGVARCVHGATLPAPPAARPSGASPGQPANRVTSAAQNAGRSRGLRLDTRLPSTTTSSSITVPPALRMSWRPLGDEVSVG